MGTTSNPSAEFTKRVREDKGEHRQRPGARNVDPAGDLRRPHGHRRRQHDGQDLETEDGPELPGHPPTQVASTSSMTFSGEVAVFDSSVGINPQWRCSATLRT